MSASRLGWWLIRGAVIGAALVGLALAAALALRAYLPDLSRRRLKRR
jgi:hypothetical protein